MFNKITILGRLGRTPEIRHTQSGKEVANLSVATDYNIKTGDNWEKHTEWHQVVLWGNLANKAREASKGSLVFVEGRIQTRKWQGQDGTEKTVKEIVASSFLLLAESRQKDTSTKEDSDVPF